MMSTKGEGVDLKLCQSSARNIC